MGAGRKPKYNEKLVNKICQLVETDTYMVAEICRLVKIDRATYFRWLKEKSEFNDAIKRAEEARSETLAMEAERSLMKLVKGYTVQEKHVTTVGSGKYDVNGVEKPKIKEQKVVDKHYQPVPAAVFFALTNTKPDKWKNRLNSELTGKGGKELAPARILTKKELVELYKDLEKEY